MVGMNLASAQLFGSNTANFDTRVKSTGERGNYLAYGGVEKTEYIRVRRGIENQVSEIVLEPACNESGLSWPVQNSPIDSGSIRCREFWLLEYFDLAG
jgi:hypothetical protein